MTVSRLSDAVGGFEIDFFKRKNTNICQLVVELLKENPL